MKQARARYGSDYTIDPDLWFVDREHCGGRQYLIGNPHTHRGHFAVYCAANDVGFSATKDDLDDEASPAPARGSTGSSPGTSLAPRTSPGRASTTATMATSGGSGGGPLPASPPHRLAPVASLVGTAAPPTAALPAVPVWCLRGAQVWRWTGDAWAYVDPQPELDWLYLPGSVCAQREAHDSFPVEEDPLEVCRDCGFLEPTT